MTIEKAIEGTTSRYKARIDFTHKGEILMAEAGLSQKEVVSAAFDGQKGCAAIFTKLKSGDLCHDRAAGLWYLYEGHFWILDKMGVAVRSCDDVQAVFNRVEAELNAETIEIAAEMRQADSADDKEKLKEKDAKIQAQIGAIATTVRYLNTLHIENRLPNLPRMGWEAWGSAAMSGTKSRMIWLA